MKKQETAYTKFSKGYRVIKFDLKDCNS